MKTLLTIILIVLTLNSCVKKESKIVKPIEYSVDFEKYSDEDRLLTIDLDTIRNYAELRKEMGNISCKEKVSGLKINTKTKVYYITGFVPCPRSGEVSCYFRRINITIKNDSIFRSWSGNNKDIPIESLNVELDTIMSYPFNLQYKKEVLKPALIKIYMDHDTSVSIIKKVLVEIAEQFQTIRNSKGSAYFNYQILFKNIDYFAIKPPMSSKHEKVIIVE